MAYGKTDFHATDDVGTAAVGIAVAPLFIV